MSDAPERIWVDPDINDHTAPASEDWNSGSWGVDGTWGGTEYVRADRITQLEAERDALEAALNRMTHDWGKADMAKMEAEARADAAEAKLREAVEALRVQKKAAQDYCWQRYEGRSPLNLSTPAVFTSHEWQKIGEAMDAAVARTTLARLTGEEQDGGR